jgi:hypothetical protein
MAKSRLSMRREVEAAEALEEAPAKKKVAKTKTTKTTKAKAPKKATGTKKKAAPRPRKKKSEMPARRRLVWVVYSSTMREEGRFLYHERDKAEERLNSLLSKGKRRYFIQPIKEALDSEGQPMVPDEERSKKMDIKEDPETEEVEVEVDADAEVEVPDEVGDMVPETSDDD